MFENSCVIIPSYRAAKVLPATVSRIPDEFTRNGGKIIIINDKSPDDTGEVAEEIARSSAGIQVIHHSKNLGYGGAQKSGLRRGLEGGCEAFAIVHADGQYAPELVPELLTPILKGEAEIVQGSRLLKGNPLQGGMPWTRYAANRSLTLLENLAFGTQMAEFHSGYMLYSRKLLQSVPFEKLQNNFNFDAEIILVAHLAGLPCHQLPIPTHYGEESSSLDPIPYGMNVLRMIARHLGGHYLRLLEQFQKQANPDRIFNNQSISR